MSNPRGLAELIRDRRKELGLDQPTLAAQLGVSQQTVSRWEKGLNTPARRFLSVLAEVLKLEPDRVFRIAGYYQNPLSEQSHDHVFDAAIAAMSDFTDKQLLDILDLAWRVYRARNVLRATP